MADVYATDVAGYFVDSWINGNRSWVIGELKKMGPLDASAVSASMMDEFRRRDEDDGPFLSRLELESVGHFQDYEYEIHGEVDVDEDDLAFRSEEEDDFDEDEDDDD
jgi:hypothetical protein